MIRVTPADKGGKGETMKEVTDWTQKGQNTDMRSSGSQDQKKKSGDSTLMKAALTGAAGLIVAALAKGVRNSDYYDREDEE